MFGLKRDEKKLFKSILENDLNTVRELAPKIKNKKILNKDKKTPFMIGMKNYNLDICELLSELKYVTYIVISSTLTLSGKTTYLIVAVIPEV